MYMYVFTIGTYLPSALLFSVMKVVVMCTGVQLSVLLSSVVAAVKLTVATYVCSGVCKVNLIHLIYTFSNYGRYDW